MLNNFFVKSKNGVGIACLRFLDGCNSFEIHQNVLHFTYGNHKQKIFFGTFSKVYSLDDKTNISILLDYKDDKWYSYSDKKYIIDTPNECLQNFIKHNFVNVKKGMELHKFFYVLYD